MAFKAQSKVTDLNLELTDISGNVHEIPPVKLPNSGNIRKYTALQLNAAKIFSSAGVVISGDELEMNKSVMESYTKGTLKDEDLMDIMTKQIEMVDFWYEKGSEFWVEHFDRDVMTAILNHINSEVGNKKK